MQLSAGAGPHGAAADLAMAWQLHVVSTGLAGPSL